MKTTPAKSAFRPAAGLSMVELMVGLVVGLLVSLTAVSSSALFTASQRQGIGTGGAGSNLSSVMAAMKDDIANGGLGFFVNASYVCNTLNLSNGAAVVSNNSAFAPVLITRVGNNDQLDVVYGNDVSGGAAVKLSTSSDGLTTATLKNYLPAVANQAVLLAPVSNAQPCVVRTLTATPAAPTALVKEALTFANTGLHNQAAFATNGAYPENSLVTLIGSVQWNRYQLNGTDLRMTRLLDGTTVTLARNVMGMRFEYGVSAVGTPALLDGARAPLSSWEDPTDAGWSSVDSTNINRIKAVRMGLVVRSAQREKENKDSGVCEASSTMPQLFGNTITPDVSDWRCYRYRTLIAVIPLRNMIYGL